jgi:hypothetical protein
MELVDDNSIAWMLGFGPETYEQMIQNVAEHEFGHFLSLGHVISPDFEVMGTAQIRCFSHYNCKAPRTLQYGDSNGTRYTAPTIETQFEWLLSNSNTSPTTSIDFVYGNPSLHDIPIVGDWNGDGLATIGVLRPTADEHWEWLLRNSNSSGPPDYDFVYGNRAIGALPVVGDWNGDGVVTIGVAEPQSDGNNGYNYDWKLRDHNSAGSPEETEFLHGSLYNDPDVVAGNWDTSDVLDSAGITQPDSTNHWEWHLRNLPGNGNLLPLFTHGTSNLEDHPIVGDWNGDGVKTIGVSRPTSTNKWEWLLRNANSGGSANIDVTYGSRGLEDVPVVGDWNGDGKETIGVARPE